MGDISYSHYKDKKDYFNKSLRRLENLYGRQLIERESSLLSGSKPWNCGPGEGVTGNQIDASITRWEHNYPVFDAFQFRHQSGFVTKAELMDYGRCVLYLCEGRDRGVQEIYVFVYDRKTDVFYMAGHQDRGELKRFIEFLKI